MPAHTSLMPALTNLMPAHTNLMPTHTNLIQTVKAVISPQGRHQLSAVSHHKTDVFYGNKLGLWKIPDNTVIQVAPHFTVTRIIENDN